MTSRPLSLALLAVASLALAQKTAAPLRAAVPDLLKNGKKFDRKLVVVQGTVAKYQARTSKAGKPYLLFDLVQGKDAVHVYSFGKLDKAPKNGGRVRVVGVFAVSRKSGSREFKNEIDASPKRDAKNGKPAVTLL